MKKFDVTLLTPKALKEYRDKRELSRKERDVDCEAADVAHNKRMNAARYDALGKSGVDPLTVEGVTKPVDPIVESDYRIGEAIVELSKSERGQEVLRAFKRMAIDAGARGLDLAGCEALETLTHELLSGQRRSFLDGIESAPDYRKALERIAASEHHGLQDDKNAEELDRVLLIARETLGRKV